MAYCILINLVFLFVVITRFFITLFYKIPEFLPRLVQLPFRNYREFHRALGYIVVLQSVIHTISHYINFWYISHASRSELVEIWGNYVGGQLYGGDEPELQYLNLLYLSIPGITGHVMLLCFFFILFTSTKYVKRQKFEYFWFSHHVFIVFFSCLMIHGMLELVEPQVAYLWVAPFFGFYALERLRRLILLICFHPVKSLCLHDNEVISITLSKSKQFLGTTLPDCWSYKTGQWAWICIPSISCLEWHPFTLTSCPEEEYITMDIRICGDWTRQVANLVESETKPRICFDGCYGADSQMVGRYNVSVLVGCGIGLTPFIAVLKHFRHTGKYGQIYLVAIVRTRPFQFILNELEAVTTDQKVSSRFHLHLYITQPVPETDNINLKGNIVCGSRPSFQEIFMGLAHRHPHESIIKSPPFPSLHAPDSFSPKLWEGIPC
eukprot:TRINITY_DN4586_c0_g1_i12.p1 TRINITY_DN4586_c0_g1~~TRINITY_DN4586_c0_g1_i12.p1  ORF type:complete len:436 (-),score=34.88 TRINITY_DN4586_c0_g1_i12:552-1859(-)